MKADPLLFCNLSQWGAWNITLSAHYGVFGDRFKPGRSRSNEGTELCCRIQLAVRHPKVLLHSKLLHLETQLDNFHKPRCWECHARSGWKPVWSLEFKPKLFSLEPLEMLMSPASFAGCLWTPLPLGQPCLLFTQCPLQRFFCFVF